MSLSLTGMLEDAHSQVSLDRSRGREGANQHVLVGVLNEYSSTTTTMTTTTTTTSNIETLASEGGLTLAVLLHEDLAQCHCGDAR